MYSNTNKNVPNSLNLTLASSKANLAWVWKLVLHVIVTDTILSTDIEDILCFGNWLILVQKA